MRAPRVLHLAASFGPDDPQAQRCVRIANAFGKALRHRFVAVDGAFGAMDRLDRGIVVERVANFPPLSGLPLPGRMQAIARAMVDHNLICTYGRGGTGAAMAHTVFSAALRLPPLIHHEDGSDETLRQRHGLASTWSRRLALGKAAGLVVPTELMEGEALVRWQQPIGRVKTIVDGVDLAALGKPLRGESLPRLIKQQGERWIACLTGEAPPAAIDALIDGLAGIGREWHLVLAGPPLGSGHETKIASLSLDDRVHRIPPPPQPDTLIRLADIVAVTGGRAPLPLAAISAMAAGKPLVGIETGALAAGLAPDNAPFILPAEGSSALAARLRDLAGDDAVMIAIGTANRARAVAVHDGAAMIAAYRRLYGSAIGVDAL